MPIETEKVKEVLKEPINKDKIASFVSHEERLKFHSQISLGRHVVSRAANTFLKWVEGILKKKDKYSMFLTLFKYPINTVSLVDEAYSQLEKVFDGSNPVQEHNFTDEDKRTDYLAYRVDELGFPFKFNRTSFSTMKNSINSFMIVDLPSEQITDTPEPYYYFMDVSNAIDWKMVDGDDQKVEWAIFKQGEDKYLVYDDVSYKVYNVKDGAIVGEAIVDAPHDLGYCPAQFFWSEYISEHDKQHKVAPITSQLTELDWILFFGISKRQADLYAPYPIYYGITQECNYEDEHKGYSCDNGYIINIDNRNVLNPIDQTLMECPNCASNIAGVGTYINVPPPDENTPDMWPPIGKEPADVGSLDYNVAESGRLERKFYKAVTGNSIESINDKAVNEKQVISLFESRKQALTKLKVNFERAQEWIESTVCKLRYGDSHISTSINYGTDFYLFTTEETFQMYQSAVDSNLDSITLDMLQDQAYKTKYRNDPDELRNVMTLLHLDPFRHVSSEDVKAMHQSNDVSYVDMMMKVNLSSYTMKFERMNGPISEFGTALTFDARINKIDETIRSFIIKPEDIAQTASADII